MTATQVGTYTWQASYSGRRAEQRRGGPGGANEQVTTVKASPGITTTPGGTVTLGNITISGTKYLDLTGNGFSSDDTRWPA